MKLPKRLGQWFSWRNRRLDPEERFRQAYVAYYPNATQDQYHMALARFEASGMSIEEWEEKVAAL